MVAGVEESMEERVIEASQKRKGASGPPQWLRGITFNREAESGNHERKSYGRAPNCQGERVRLNSDASDQSDTSNERSRAPELAVLLNPQNCVLGAVRIWLVNGAGGIITPLAIDDETVTMGAGREFDGSAPDTCGFLFELDGFFLPMGEVTGEHDSLGGRRGEGEDLLFAWDLF